jgi:hypothetical protein
MDLTRDTLKEENESGSGNRIPRRLHYMIFPKSHLPTHITNPVAHRTFCPETLHFCGVAGRLVHSRVCSLKETAVANTDSVASYCGRLWCCLFHVTSRRLVWVGSSFGLVD